MAKIDAQQLKAEAEAVTA
ncbi:hypothetical protein Gpo141_00014418, partial [Globisporangium polare]